MVGLGTLQLATVEWLELPAERLRAQAPSVTRRLRGERPARLNRKRQYVRRLIKRVYYRLMQNGGGRRS